MSVNAKSQIININFCLTEKQWHQRSDDTGL